MYLIRDAAGEIVGRVNLSDVQRGPVQSAEIGYRVGEGHEGRGYATQAVGLIVAEAFETLGLHRVEAATAPANVGSQLVLVRNGFAPYGRAHGAILVHGVWHDSLLFELTNPSWS